MNTNEPDMNSKLIRIKQLLDTRNSCDYDCYMFLREIF